MSARVVVSLAVALALGACRDDAGDPDLDRLGPVVHPPGFGEEPLPGPDPYEAGERRLSFGAFYEGGYSDLLAVDGQTIHYYIYMEEPSGLLTYQQLPDDDHVEGLVADRLVHGGRPWWGGGIHFDAARDLSGWGTLHLSLKSSSPAFSEVDIGMISEDGDATVAATDYGYEADGQWHTLAIPLDDLADAGVDLTAITAALTLGGGAGTGADALKIDAVYLTDP
ncbi:MAG: hypothetical protein IT385_01415 [Deltaproteobacteria bacterium]|nr:hypothetical protein [Deltaproteobacteria bacterium]